MRTNSRDCSGMFHRYVLGDRYNVPSIGNDVMKAWHQPQAEPTCLPTFGLLRNIYTLLTITAALRKIVVDDIIVRWNCRASKSDIALLRQAPALAADLVVAMGKCLDRDDTECTETGEWTGKWTVVMFTSMEAMRSGCGVR